MSKILVSGLINIETTLKIESFPLNYYPVTYPFDGVNVTVSGVGYNIARALTTLGDDISLVSMTGCDPASDIITSSLSRDRIGGGYILKKLDATPQSVIIYEKSGRRQIHVDLKSIQNTEYPTELFEKASSGAKIVALCNINFSRRFLNIARSQNRIIATDVHAISSIDDIYNNDFMKYADILFQSDEALPCEPEEWAKKVISKFGTEILVIGLGARGALMAVKSNNHMRIYPAVATRPVVNTIGAGDALFSAFIHFYNKNFDPYESIKKAVVYASCKIGANGGADGFLNEKDFETLYRQYGER